MFPSHDPCGGLGLKGGWKNGIPNEISKLFKFHNLDKRLNLIEEKHSYIEGANSLVHLGSLGGGNHFIELCLDETDNVWIMLHSGSRGVGNRIGTYFISKAKELHEKRGISIPDKDLSWIEESDEIFPDYMEALKWAQDAADRDWETK